MLEKHQRIIDVVVIDPRGFWEYQPAASKAIVAPEHAVVLPQAEVWPWSTLRQRDGYLPKNKGIEVSHLTRFSRYSPQGTLRKAVRCVVRADEDDMAAGVTVLFEDSTEMTADFAIICTGSNAPRCAWATETTVSLKKGRKCHLTRVTFDLHLTSQRLCAVR